MDWTKKIKLAREAAELTQEQLAEKLGVRLTKVARFEKGVGRRPVDFFVLFCRAVHADPGDMLNPDIVWPPRPAFSSSDPVPVSEDVLRAKLTPGKKGRRRQRRQT